MGNITSLQIYKIIEQQEEQEDFLTKERHAEEANLNLITMNKEQVIFSEKGKAFSRSLYSYTSSYCKDINENEKRARLLLIANEELFDDFKSYVMSKASKARKEEYKVAFADTDFINDVKNLLKIKSLEYKEELQMKGQRGFYSPKAQRLYSIMSFQRNARKYEHESINTAKKYYSHLNDGRKVLLSESQMNQLINGLKPVLKEIADNTLGEYRQLYVELHNPNEIKRLS